jgi:multiphosphoryl transfer protein
MSQEFSFSWPLASGLHARPASHMAEIAKRFRSDCALNHESNGTDANGKSVLSLVAADVRMGDTCRIRFTGADEAEACAAIKRFVEQELPLLDEPAASADEGRQAGALPRALQDVCGRWYPGTAVSRGIGKGKVVLMGGMSLPPELNGKHAAVPELERERLEQAVGAVRARLAVSLARATSRTEVEILKAHVSMASDVSLLERLAELISQGRTAGQAVAETGQFFVEQLKKSASLYIRERAEDVEDICLQLLEEIYGPDFRPADVSLTEPSVVVAESMAPRQLLSLDRGWLKALVLGCIGNTSHTAILARSLCIPALVAVKDAPLVLAAGEQVVVDATRGVVIAELNPPVRRFYEREAKLLRRREEALIERAQARVETADGQSLVVAANVATAEESVTAFARGADGIGLFRTEMLFLGKDRAPSEEEQFAIYAQTVRSAGGRPVIIRTLDVGGDKPLPYLDLPQENNPFLGYRGMRIYPEHEQLLVDQLRAILRASAFGRVQVMAPMVSSVAEARWFKERVARVKSDLAAEGAAFDAATPVGIMIEVPSVAFILDRLCAEVDFFSIGTNDLAQYFFAVDRGNAKVAPLGSVRHPGLLQLLKQIVDEIHQHGKLASMCGEMAGDVRNLPLLVGLELNEISVAAQAIPALKAAVSRLTAAECRNLLAQAIACADTAEVDELLKSESRHHTVQPLLDGDLIRIDSASESKAEVIQEMVEALYVAARTEDPQQVEDAVWAREAVYSTGLGHGFAIPHCKTDAVAHDSVVILKLKTPIEWGALDGEPVRMVILLATRESAANGTHMRVFSQLARKLMHEEFRDALLGATDAPAILTKMVTELNLSAAPAASN